MKDISKEIDSGPFNKWFIIDKNIHILKKNTTVGRIYPNVSSFDIVSEWQSDVYRRENGILIEGAYTKYSELDTVKILVEKEINYLMSISIPYRN